jgi:CRP-like cAMP-binding protein
MSRKKKPSRKAPFDPQRFLQFAGRSTRVATYATGERIFSQGDPGDKVIYIQDGTVKLSVVSPTGKEAVVAVLKNGDFFGEGCLTAQPLRMGTATAMGPTTVMEVKKQRMAKLLHEQPALSDLFIAHMLERNIRIEEDLIDQLFNSSEKRLARTLLLLAHFDEHQLTRHALPTISRDLLAEIIGTSRAKVDVLMNKFRKLGFLERHNEREGGLQVHCSMLSAVLQD